MTDCWKENFWSKTGLYGTRSYCSFTVDQRDMLQVPWNDAQAEEEFPFLVVNITK